MYAVKIESYFSSAHSLRGYKGKCEELHGHNWKVEVTVEAGKLDKLDMVLDFRDLKMKLNKITEELDHKYLNNIPYFSATGGSASGGKKVNPVRSPHRRCGSRLRQLTSNGINPTSESIAQYIYDRLKKGVPKVKLVTVWESHNSCASYYE